MFGNHNLVLCYAELKPAVESLSPEITVDFIHWAGLSELFNRVLHYTRADFALFSDHWSKEKNEII